MTPYFHILSKRLKRTAPITVSETTSSTIQAHPLPLEKSLTIQRTKRSIWAFLGASGQFENWVTSGIDSSAKKGSASSIRGPRKSKRSVTRDGNSPFPVIGIVGKRGLMQPGENNKFLRRMHTGVSRRDGSCT